MKRYKKLFESSTLMQQALQQFKSYLKNSEYDDNQKSKLKTNIETQKYKPKLDKTSYEINVSGIFRKLKTMDNELSKSFINKMIKKWNKRSSLSVLKGSSITNEILIIIEIIEEVISKLKK